MIKSALKFLIGALIILPIMLIFIITQTELKKYEPPLPESFGNKAYGVVEPIYRKDINEIIPLSGVYISKEYEFIDFSFSNESNIKFHYEVGDEISIEDVIVSINKKNITSPWSGIITEINTESTSGYIKIQKVDNLIFEGYIPASSPRLEINKTYQDQQTKQLKHT